jgi:hypothetical protein
VTIEFAIVGGGVHGTHVAAQLLAETRLDRDELAIVEPEGELLASFSEKARRCGMASLRSTYVQHVGTEPFGLEGYARTHDREDELLPTRNYPRRPSLSLFLDHATHLIDRLDLDSSVVTARAEGVRRRDEGLRIQTSEGPIDARRCLLAVGYGGRYAIPEWADLGTDAPVWHVWEDGFEEGRVGDETVVVGGSISAVSLALSLAERGWEVTLLSRHRIETETVECDPYWLNWSYIEDRLHHLPPASRTRYDTIRAARYDSTAPRYLTERLREAASDGRLEVRRGEVESAYTGGSLTLRLSDGRVKEPDSVVLATGFADVYSQPLLRSVAESMDLATGYRGMPDLCDETLSWRTEGGERSPVFATGAFAEGAVGPFARNLPGARRAADRLVEVVDSRAVAPPSASD